MFDPPCRDALVEGCFGRRVGRKVGVDIVDGTRRDKGDDAIVVEVIERCSSHEVGADLYMTKPFDPDEVLERVAEVLGIELA